MCKNNMDSKATGKLMMLLRLNDIGTVSYFRKLELKMSLNFKNWCNK